MVVKTESTMTGDYCIEKPSASCLDHFTNADNRKVSLSLFFWVVSACFSFCVIILSYTISINNSKLDKDQYIQDTNKSNGTLEKIYDKLQKLESITTQINYIEKKVDFLYERQNKNLK